MTTSPRGPHMQPHKHDDPDAIARLTASMRVILGKGHPLLVCEVRVRDGAVLAMVAEEAYF